MRISFILLHTEPCRLMPSSDTLTIILAVIIAVRGELLRMCSHFAFTHLDHDNMLNMIITTVGSYNVHT